jgi:hypothetical protein
LDSKDHNVREAACRAAGGVDTSISVDKIKLADRLIKSVQDEPAKAETSRRPTGPTTRPSARPSPRRWSRSPS